MIVSHTIFIWFVTAITGGLNFAWGVREVFLLRRFWPERRVRHDEFFGSMVGLVIAVLGVFGCFKYHLGL